MTEKILKEYFDGITSAEVLSIYLNDTVHSQGNVSTYNILNFKSDTEFVVTTKHLIKLCADLINKKIKLEYLKAICFCLESSDFFIWDTGTKDGNLVEGAISNLSSVKINAKTTMAYIEYCAYYLETGEHR